MLFPMVHDKGGLSSSICMYSVISKTTMLFVCEVHMLGIFGLSVAPQIHVKKCAIFLCANIFCD
jgi:preprotein translocase subunit SecB